MKLSRKLHQELESFFRECFGNDKLNLPEIEIYGKRGARFVTRALSVHGITFGRHIFIKPSLISRNSKQKLSMSKELLAHEATHVLQYDKLGFLIFFYTYLKGYLAALKRKPKWDFQSRLEAYWEIPQEQEARECAAKFIEWSARSEKLKVEN
jgi:hypothetical protein